MFAMPWKESRIMDERVKFFAEVLKGERKSKNYASSMEFQGRLATNGLNDTRKPDRKDWRISGGGRKAVLMQRRIRSLKKFSNCVTSIQLGEHANFGRNWNKGRVTRTGPQPAR